MSDIKLPAGYEDWVEAEYPGSDNERLRVMFDYFPGDGYGTQKKAQWLVPPKPKPTLPDVKPGAVIRFTHKAYGSLVQAVKWKSGGAGWHIQFRGAGNVLCETYCGDVWLLENVNADGFTVEMEGL